MEIGTVRLVQTLLIGILATILLPSCINSWEKGQFSSCEEMSDAFDAKTITDMSRTGISYLAITRKFGSPYYKEPNFLGEEMVIECKWKGVGVQGHDITITFESYHSSYNTFEPSNVKYISYCDDEIAKVNPSNGSTIARSTETEIQQEFKRSWGVYGIVNSDLKVLVQQKGDSIQMSYTTQGLTGARLFWVPLKVDFDANAQDLINLTNPDRIRIGTPMSVIGTLNYGEQEYPFIDEPHYLRFNGTQMEIIIPAMGSGVSEDAAAHTFIKNAEFTLNNDM